MNEQDEYRRATNPNLPDDHETKKIRLTTRVPRIEKWIAIGMVLVLVINMAAIAKQNGWF